MLEIQDRPVILLTALDYTFSLLKIIQVYFLTQKLLLFSQWFWWILVQGCDYSYISLTFLHSHYNIIQTSQVRVGVHICKSCTQPQAKDSIYLNSLQTNQQKQKLQEAMWLVVILQNVDDLPQLQCLLELRPDFTMGMFQSCTSSMMIL